MEGLKRTIMPIVVLGLTLASALVTLRATPADAASLASLTVSPTHGAPTDRFTATYQVSPCQSAAGQAVSFYWDGVPQPAAGHWVRPLPMRRARRPLTTAPPANAATGNHMVWGFLPLNDGSPVPGSSGQPRVHGGRAIARDRIAAAGQVVHLALELAIAGEAL